mmetsp:Transcript_11658/g.48486  ORF Transcript_11658/g.48486 Transcript_11658/m.48486 type:complete len:90 (+) Transcript_11658:2042-2311(+)
MRQQLIPNGLRAVSPSKEYLCLLPDSSMPSWLTDMDEARLLLRRPALKRRRPQSPTLELMGYALLPLEFFRSRRYCRIELRAIWSVGSW